MALYKRDIPGRRAHFYLHFLLWSALTEPTSLLDYCGLLWWSGQVFVQGINSDTFRRLVLFSMFWHFLDLILDLHFYLCLLDGSYIACTKNLPDMIKLQYHGTLSGYLIGLVLSFLLSVSSFYLVWAQALPIPTLIYTIIGLCLIQATVQLYFFMHIGKEEKPRWQSISFLFMLVCVVIIVLGSLWIMYDLNNRVMGGMEM